MHPRMQEPTGRTYCISLDKSVTFCCLRNEEKVEQIAFANFRKSWLPLEFGRVGETGDNCTSRTLV